MHNSRLRNIMILAIGFALVSLACSDAIAQRGPGFGRGFRGGRGAPGQAEQGRPGAGEPAGQHGHDDRHDEDRDLFHFLLTNHEKINRKVTLLDDGVETLTESKDALIADKIKEHVEWMKHRVENSNPIRMRDPLFAEIFRHTDKIEMNVEETKHGVRVTETSDDPYVAKLIQQHADVVSGFVSRGFDEAMRNHPVEADKTATQSTKLDKQFPTVAKYGGVLNLPDAAQQPRDGSRVVVDVTGGGDANELYPAIDKVARYVNLYAGGGKVAVTPRMVVILHGDATLACLNPDAYSKKFGSEGNPNLECMGELHTAGVEFYVCGQSLISKGGDPDDTVPFVEVAVSAMTSLVNLQADGYAYIPLR